MTESEKKLSKVIDFLQECEQYLHSWCCTRTGKYVTVDTQGVRKILMNMVASGSKNPIREFKEGVENGTIILSTFAFGLPEEREKLLYENHCKNIKKFEKKYKV